MARPISVILTADTAGYVRNMAAAEAANKRFKGSTKDLSSFEKQIGQINKASGDLNKISNTLLGFGAAGAAGLGAAAKAAIDWESAWAGVTKTVDGTSRELASLEDSLRNMARTMPTSHKDIAAVAEAAGQLGVATKDVAGFTRNMVMLGDTTNLSADEAATSIAQLMNVMGTAPKDVGRLSSTLVDLGNKGASTEAQIIQMAQRIAGAGKQVGLSETQVLSFANALASVGIEVEAGGTAISTSFLKMDKAVRGGGKGLETLASTAGMTSEQFVKAWRDDAGQAATLFVEGLGEVQRQGGDTNQILKDLGITGIRESDALRRLANSGDLLADSLKNGAVAWESNSALAIEASKRYETTESKMKIAVNNIKDAGIDVGEVLLPAIAEIADGVADLAKWFGSLSPEMKNFVVKAAVVASAGALMAGGLMRGVTAASDLVAAFSSIRSAAPGLVSRLGKVGAAGGVAAAAIGSMLIVDQVANAIQGEFNPSLSQSTKLLADLATGAQGATDRFDEFFSGKSHGFGEVQGLSESLEILSARTKTFSFNLDDGATRAKRFGFWLQDARKNLSGTESDVDVAEKKFRALDDALATMSESGSLELAQKGFRQMRKEIENGGGSIRDVMPYMENYKATLETQAEQLGVFNISNEEYVAWMGGRVPDAVQKAATQIQRAGDATESQREMISKIPGAAQEMNTALGELETAEEELAKATQEVIDQFTILKGGALDADRAADKFRDSLHDLKKSVKENGAEIADHTQKGRENKEAIRQSIEALNDKITADYKATAETKGLKKATKDAAKELREGREDILDHAEAAGLNREKVADMIDTMVKTPKELKTEAKLTGIDELKRKVKELQFQIDNLSGTHDVRLNYQVLHDGTKVKITDNGKVVSNTKGNMGTAWATGGYISGPGTGTSDDIPAWLSNGEYVIKASSVAKLGKNRLDYINQMGDVPKFRDGGLVNNGPSNNGPNGALGPAVVPVVNIAGEIANGAVSAILGLVKQTSDSIRDRATDHFTAQMFGMFGGVGGVGGDAVAPVPGSGNRHSGYPWATYAADFPNPTGTPVRAWKAGTVAAVNRWGHSYGNHIRLRHGDGTRSLYAHLSQILTGMGDQVMAGQTIGRVGSTGNSTGPHLHFEVEGGPYVTGKGGGSSQLSGKLSGAVSGATQILGRAMMIANGLPASEWPALRQLWMGESHWDPWAVNPSSGAYGIPQILPAAHGYPVPKGDAEAQIRWGLAYIRQRYGTPSRALAAWQGRNPHWYATGGPVSGPGTGTSDDIPAWLSNGEYVINAKSTQKHRLLLDMINADKFATGGQVGNPLPATSGVNLNAIYKLLQNLQDPIRELRQFAKAVEAARREQERANKALRKPRQALNRASDAYDDAKAERDALRLSNARGTNKNKSLVAKRTEELKAARQEMAKLEPASKKAASAQRALESALKARDAKAKSNAESIAKLNDKIAKAKKGTLAYTNLINERELKQKSNSRALAAENDKVAKARKEAEKAGVKTARIEAAQEKVRKAELALERARAKQSKTSRDNTLSMAEANAKVSKALAAKKKAQEAYDRAADRAKDKSAKLKEATDKLRQAQEQLADAARSSSDAFAGLYTDPSGGFRGLISNMKTGATEITAFTKQVEKLRKLGLNEGTIQQILGIAQSEGVQAAGQFANELLGGGKGGIRQLNDAAKKLSDAADKLGYLDATARGRFATGGLVSGPGTGTSDSITARLSNGEYVVNAAATAQHRGLLDAINYGRYRVPGYATGGYVRRVLPAQVAAAVPSGRQYIEGTLDLGNGLKGYVRGVVREENNRMVTAAGRRAV